MWVFDEFFVLVLDNKILLFIFNVDIDLEVIGVKCVDFNVLVV